MPRFDSGTSWWIFGAQVVINLKSSSKFSTLVSIRGGKILGKVNFSRGENLSYWFCWLSCSVGSIWAYENAWFPQGIWEEAVMEQILWWHPLFNRDTPSSMRLHESQQISCWTGMWEAPVGCFTRRMFLGLGCHSAVCRVRPRRGDVAVLAPWPLCTFQEGTALMWLWRLPHCSRFLSSVQGGWAALRWWMTKPGWSLFCLCCISQGIGCSSFSSLFFLLPPALTFGTSLCSGPTSFLRGKHFFKKHILLFKSSFENG